MAKIVVSLLALARLTLVQGLPAGDVKGNPDPLRERAVPVSTGLEATTSYISAIESLQSEPITVLPTATGVCTVNCLWG
jgi:endo-1,3(4)-beta-glucanase